VGDREVISRVLVDESEGRKSERGVRVLDCRSTIIQTENQLALTYPSHAPETHMVRILTYDSKVK
jgi:hypothetical protein